MLLSHNTLTVALIAACVAVEHGGAAEEKVTVEVDVFSGRPNPAWTMSPSDARATVRMLNQLPGGAPGVVEDRLGYRGTIIRTKNAEWRLFRGRAFEVGKRVWRLDVDRRMERVALTSGKSFLDMATYKMVLEEAGFGPGNREEKHEH